MRFERLRPSTNFELRRSLDDPPREHAQAFVMAASRNRLSHPGQQDGIHLYNRLFHWLRNTTVPSLSSRGGAGA